MTKQRHNKYLISLLTLTLLLSSSYCSYTSAQIQANHILLQQDHKADFAKKKKKRRGEDAKKEKKGRFFLGGGFGGGYNNGWNINISPLVGYQFNDRLRVGTGIEYQYINQRTVFGTNRFSAFGPYAMGQYLLTQTIIGHAEYQQQRYKFGNQNFDVRSLLLGGGFTRNFGRGAGFSLLVLYDVLYNTNTEVQRISPWIIRPVFIYGF